MAPLPDPVPVSTDIDGVETVNQYTNAVDVRPDVSDYILGDKDAVRGTTIDVPIIFRNNTAYEAHVVTPVSVNGSEVATIDTNIPADSEKTVTVSFKVPKDADYVEVAVGDNSSQFRTSGYLVYENYSLSTDTPEPGETVTLGITITNTLNESTTEDIPVTYQGDTVRTITHTFGPGGSERFSADFTAPDSGRMEGSIGNASFGLEVEEQTDPPDDDPDPPDPADESSISASDVNASSSEANIVTVSYNVNNTIESGSGETVAGTVRFKVDGDQLHSESISIQAGDTKSYQAEVSGVTEGQHTVCVTAVR